MATRATTKAKRPALSRMIVRGLFKRCAVCGQRGVFKSWSTMVDACPRCGHRFNREEGYWVGAIIVNLAVIETLFAVLFVGTMLATAPDIPWQPLLIIALVTNGLMPWLFYPNSKSVWVGLDVYFSPARSQDRGDPTTY